MSDPKILAGAERVCQDVLARRGAQIEHGYDAAYDDKYLDGDIVTNARWGAASLLIRAAAYANENDPARRNQLVKAASLLVAEIERIDRARERLLAAQNRPSEEIIREDRDAWPDYQANDPVRPLEKGETND
jgi:hypothetical protein